MILQGLGVSSDFLMARMAFEIDETLAKRRQLSLTLDASRCETD